jgi:hypothetical protein
MFVFDALLELVLDLLGGYWFDAPEYVEEAVEAVDVWRSGEGEAAVCPSRVRGE